MKTSTPDSPQQTLRRVQSLLNDVIGNFHAFIERRDRDRGCADSIHREHQALMDSGSRFTDEETEEVFRRGATYPGTEEALAKGDAVLEDYVKGLSSFEVRSRSGSPSLPSR